MVTVMTFIIHIILTMISYMQLYVRTMRYMYDYVIYVTSYISYRWHEINVVFIIINPSQTMIIYRMSLS